MYLNLLNTFLIDSVASLDVTVSTPDESSQYTSPTSAKLISDILSN